MFWKKSKSIQKIEPKKIRSFFSTDIQSRDVDLFALDDMLNNLKVAQPAYGTTAQDDSSDGFPMFKQFANQPSNMSEVLMLWYSSQSFIGHQIAGILAQHWLIQKACAMPAQDAIRKGFNCVSVEGDDLEDNISKTIKRYDRSMNLMSNLREFITFGRVFGIRIMMFKVDSTDPDYYENPFNIDGVTKGSYKGMVQLDPYWTAPMLDQAGASKPDSMHFYEPTWWMINGKKVHRSHLVIFRHSETVDILKPQYLYGGVPLPQQIMERVYAAERTANEAPQLAQTKRTNVWLTDTEAVFANTDAAIGRLNEWAYFRDNFGIKLGSKEADEFQQFDTSLADLDAVIMTQYQIVAAVAQVPATKLLGTSPKGFGASGEYEEASYHETLESIQTHDLTPVIERHHALVIRSFTNEKELQTTVSWNPLDTPTAQELAQTNLLKAQTGAALVQSGAISSEDERKRVALDKVSGYHELGLGDEELPDLDDDNESESE